MITSALNELIASDPSPSWKGRVPSRWFNNLGLSFDINGLSSNGLKREDLFTLCNDPVRSTLECIASICAWGGMKVDHGKALFSTQDEWLPAVEDLRKGKHTRVLSYSRFSSLRASGKLRGCGPAYFTKFIFFMTSGQPGFIMDQWTTKSIHLLTGSTRPILNKSGYVTDQNTALDYERFCLEIEQLARKLNLTPQATEEKIFSIGGKRLGQWRRYVKDNWRHAK